MPDKEPHRSAIRAFQAGPLLTSAARHHQLITYQELGEHVGLLSIGVGPDALHLIALYCEAKGLPLLNSIAVRKDTFKPGYDVGDLAEEWTRVFKHNWIDKEKHATPVPSIAEFEQYASKGAAA
jgi:hypothetical protein